MEKKIIDWSKSTYSGTDVGVVASLNFSSLEKAFIKDNLNYQGLGPTIQQLDGLVFELGTVQTISCQAHRPKAAVRSLGNSFTKGYTRGPRTIAGSMIFTVLNQHSLRDICRQMEKAITSGGISSTFLPDQILPIDLTFLMVNEYGNISRMALYGVEFLNNGQTMSIEDLLLEEVLQFVALDMDPLADITDKAFASSNSFGVGKTLSASDVFNKASYSSYDNWLYRVGLRRSF